MRCIANRFSSQIVTCVDNTAISGHILKGNDSTCVDWLTIVPPESLIVIIAQPHYPNELITLGKMARRKGHQLFMLFWHFNLFFFNSSSLRKCQEKETTHLGDKMS